MHIINRRIDFGGLSISACNWLGYNPFSELCAQVLPELQILEGEYRFWIRQSFSAFSEVGQVSETLDNDLRNSGGIRKGMRVVLSVPEASVFCCEIDLHSTARNRAGDVMALEIARLTPFVADQTYLGWYLGSTSDADGKVPLLGYVIRQELLSHAISLVVAAGAKVAAVVIRDEENHLLPFVIGPDRLPYRHREVRRWRILSGLGLITALMSFLVLGVSVANYQDKRSLMLTAAETTIEKNALDVRSTLDAQAKVQTTLEALDLARKKSSRRLVLVEQLSKILPQDAFLQSLTIDGDEVILEGSAASPEALIPLLEKSILNSNVGFAAPILRNSEDNTSHFSIKFKLTGETQ